MTTDELSDDFVAGLLAKDAKDRSIKYSALGMQAFLPSQAPANHPKPNTRFLRNIIRDTDSHNQALLAKEAEEAKARLRSLTGGERKQESRSAGAGRDVRKRQLGAIAAILGGQSSTRKPNEKENNAGHSKRDSSEKVNREREHRRSRRHDEDDGKRERGERSERRHRRSRSPSKERNEGRRRHRSRSRSREHRSKHRNSERLSRSRSRSPRESRRHKRSDRNSKSASRRHDTKTKDDSDPLEDIIGPQPLDPAPKIRSRGRGTISSASGIDSRFSTDYDPKADVADNPGEEDDWDQALEALRDRTKWKQQGADRLRAAGFTEEEVGKWERGGEKREEDVKWKGKGEGREWDRGKVVVEDSVDIDFGWGRLKGT